MTGVNFNLKGVFTALVTPFTQDGARVDYVALEALVESQIAAGVDGLVPMGTTGECPTVSHEEHEKVIECVVRKAAGRVTVIGGTGSNNTTEALRLTAFAKKVGCDAALMVNPYYNKPNQEGLYQHFAKVCNEVGLPIVLYNIPGRTGITMAPSTVARLYKDFPGKIVAIKEATGSLDIATEIASLCDITILSGDDSLTLPLISIGGSGVISVVSNFGPQLIKDIVDNAFAGDYAKAAAAHRRVFKLIKLMFCEPNPQPCKAAMAMLGICSATCRLPLCSVAPETEARVREMLPEFGFALKE